MNTSIINQINQDFYINTAKSFDRTRQAASPGWKKLIPYLKERPLSVIDLACGNGRFLEFLNAADITIKSYEGIDNNKSLLDKAKQKYSTQPHTTFTFIDVLNQTSTISQHLDHQQYTLITLFGIMHHLPSKKVRYELCNQLSNLLDPEGYLIFTTWEYHTDQRFSKKKLPLEIVKERYPQLNVDTLDAHDHFLTWQDNLDWIRYMHQYTSTEIISLCHKAGLTIIDSFEADGRSQRLNHYYVCKKA